MRQEVPIFEAPGVLVTSARFVCWQQTYPIAGITSVRPFTLPANRGNAGCGVVLFSFGAAACLLTAVIGIAAGNGSVFVISLLFGLVCGAFLAACVTWKRSLRDSYGVVITTAGMNVNAVHSKDFAFCNAVVGALNQAIAMRG